jgi:large subunit ribosomal protein L19
MNPVELVEKKYMDREIPEFRPGDTVRVNVRIQEGDKFRIQAFEGAVIALKRRGLQSTFTVRKVTFGYGVERVFPLYSPMIESIERLKKGRVRRAKLYYLRQRKGKAARIREIR